jgi:2-dehydro-3-deoxyphosphogluconate aldolase/(4S)-4-hydroxy-2-oxoglutarate aldolase
MSDLFRVLEEHKIIAIARGIPANEEGLGDALTNGGIRLLEVTLNTPDALKIIRSWQRRYDGCAHIGAGTVLDLEMAKQAIDAGAQFLISPNLDEDVVRLGVQNGVEVWPGVMTPTEIVRGWKAGATAVKVFPAATLGPNFFKEVRGPLSQIPLVAVGGINLQNAKEFLNAGAVGVGVGGSLFDRTLIENKRWNELEELARSYVDEVKSKIRMANA